MLGHDVGFGLIPVLQMASDPNLLTKKVCVCVCVWRVGVRHVRAARV
jgi:hypothetical protein